MNERLTLSVTRQFARDLLDWLNDTIDPEGENYAAVDMQQMLVVALSDEKSAPDA